MSALLAPDPVFRGFDNNNNPLVGGQLFTYQAGTTTPAPTYTDSTASTPNTNPVILNARGEAYVWLNPTWAYKFVLKDANGNTIWTVDQVTSPAPVAIGDMTDEKGAGGAPGFVAGTDFTPGTTTTLTLSTNYGSAANLWVAFDSAEQGADTYSLNGTTLTFNAPISVGVQKVFVKGGTALSVGTPATGSVTDAAVAAGANINSSKLGYLQGATGSTNRTVLSRLQDFVSAKDFGCKGDGVTDDTTAMQAAFAAANVAGKELFIPAGTYLLSAAVNIDNSGQSTFPAGRISVRGEGPQNTVLKWANGPAGGLSIKGSVTSIGATSMQSFRDFSVIKSDGQATGMYMQSHAHLTLENLWVLGWNVGIDYEDVQESVQNNVNAQYNVIGLHSQRLNFTLPNALLFLNCTYGNNKQAGIDCIDANTFTYIGGSIESNNDLAGGPYTPIWGCRLITNSNAVIEGAACGTFISVYFERNGSATAGKGIADLWYANYATSSTLVVKGCTFNRGTTFGTNQIFIDTSGGNTHKVSLSGNGHNAPPVGGYPGPSASRPYIGYGSTTDPVQVMDLSNYYQSSIESPNYSGSTAMPPSPVTQESNASAWVVFDGTTGAILQSFNVSSVVRNSTGNYTVNYARALQSATNCITFGLPAPGFANTNTQNANGCGVQTANTSNTAVDFGQVCVHIDGGHLA